MLQVTYFVLWLTFMLAAVAAYLSGNVPPATSLALSLVGLGLIYGLALWSVVPGQGDSNGEPVMN
jgi:hypothetical protein